MFPITNISFSLFASQRSKNSRTEAKQPGSAASSEAASGRPRDVSPDEKATIVIDGSELMIDTGVEQRYSHFFFTI